MIDNSRVHDQPAQREPRRVLVTGAGGFIGSHLVRDQLARGRSVVAVDLNLDRLDQLDLQGDVTRELADIRSTEDMRRLLHGVDIVFHLAAAHLDVLKDEAYFFEVNERATGELVRLAAEAGVQHFVHCSTVGVYGPLQTLPANETTPPAPDIAYERSKLAGEAAVQGSAAEAGISAIIVRPAWAYGPLCPRTLKLIRTIARKRFFFVGDGSALRHPIYITDMTEAFERAAVQVLPQVETVIAAGPDTVSVRQLADHIIAGLDIKFRPMTLPTWLMYPVCLSVELLAGLVRKEPPFSRRSLKFFTDSSAFDISRAGELLGFVPEVDTRLGIERTIHFYRERGDLN